MTKELIEKAIYASLLAGKEILEVYNTSDFQIEIKSDNSPLTIADKRSHNKIIEIIEPTNIPIMSEEGDIAEYNERKNWDLYWCIDPLDGTKEFIKRNGEFTVNIALMKENQTIGGVIYVPVTKELYFSDISIGAYKIENIEYSENMDFNINYLIENANKLPLNNNRKTFTVVASRSHLSDETKEFITKLENRYGEIETISKGSSLKLCMVAEGNADIYPRFAPTMEWDTAAGTAIAIGAGFKVTKADGVSPLDYNKEDLLNPWFIVMPIDFKI